MKNIVILGDSYSTYEGYIPQDYRFYYCEQGRENSPPVTKMALKDTWWKRLLDDTGDNLLQNNSWSGSTIGYTGYDGEDCSMSSSFIYRFRRLKEDGFFDKNRIDTIYIFGGTNDSWSNAPLGSMQFEDWQEKDLYSVLPAICYLIHEVKAAAKNTEIVVVINTDIKEEIQDGLQAAATRYGVKYIRLQNIEKENSGGLLHIRPEQTQRSFAPYCEQHLRRS